MVKRILSLFLLVASSSFAETANLSDTIYSIDGSRWNGRIYIHLNNPGSAQPLQSGSTSLAGWSLNLQVRNGVFRVTLFTNSSITPSGTSYNARYIPERGTGWDETWVIASGNTTLGQIRSSTVPSPTTTFGVNQISAGGATNGQVLAWNGSAWVPTTIGGGSTYTASSVFDVGSVPDGACVLHSTAVTVTGAALGGRPTIGASYQPPEGVSLTAKVTGPNSMKIEICNWSGAAYDPASSTYYFGVTQ